MTHTLYVTAAYGAAFVGIAGLIAWVVLDHRGATRRLAALEAGGVTRRSDRKGQAA